MSLMKPPRLPSRITNEEADRVARFLRQIESLIDSNASLAIYGSAAVSLYFADDSSLVLGATDDIDAAQLHPNFLDGLVVSRDLVQPPLEIRFHSVERWLVHPDWKEELVELSDLLGLKRLAVAALHPVDLVITKLERARDRDLEDAIRLVERYSISVELASKRTREASEFYPMSERAAGQIRYAFEAIFGVELKLQSDSS